ncbi:hypothetical protein WDU94_002814, partial [Cyamophila willieti]
RTFRHLSIFNSLLFNNFLDVVSLPPKLGQDRLSDPNWTWKEDIQIYRKPTLLPEYYEQYVDPDHLTMDISFDHYAHWDAKRKAGEINFPNRPDCVTTTPRYPIDRKRYEEIRHELRHFIWNPPKTENK